MVWGQHLVMNLAECRKCLITNPVRLNFYAMVLTEKIGMKAYGEPLVEHFAEENPEAAGYTLVQLIETSAITGHFVDETGDAYIDIFSCKEFDVDVVLKFTKKYFEPQEINYLVLDRHARGTTIR